MHTILGINGSTGVEIAKVLNAKGIPVRGVSRRDAPGNWEHVKGDVLNLESLKQAVAGSSVVYCCVGLEYDIQIWRRDWPVLIENVIQACLAANAKLVFIDNVYMYGLIRGVMTESTPMNPCSEKGKVRKIVAEKLLDAFASRGLKGCIARAADFYGPNVEKSALGETVLQNAVKNKTTQWLGRMDKKHAYTYVPDIGPACVNLALSEAANGQVWHLPTAAAITAKELSQIITQETGAPIKSMALRGIMLSIVALFIPVLREFKEMMYQYDEDYLFSSEKYEKAFDAKPTPYQQGIRETLLAFKNSHSA